jgi:Tol biopolymer transport system component
VDWHRRRFRNAAAICFAALGLAAIVVPLAAAAKDDLTLVSRQSDGDGGVGGDGDSRYPSISADGRYVAFPSDADNLSTADNNTYANIFVRDTQTGATTLVSRQSDADGGAGADDASSAPVISADGRYVAFGSNANNLSSADNNAYSNLFMRDMQTGSTILVSRQSASDGGGAPNDGSEGPSISADGRYVAFISAANNLSTADNDAYENIFVRDTQTDSTTLVSRQSDADGGAGADNGNSSYPAISADGHHVAFTSDADNLSSADSNTVSNTFERDPLTNVTTLLSRQSASDGGAGADAGAIDPSISADGRYVAFVSAAANLSPPDNNSLANVFVRDTQTNSTALASRQSASDGGAAANNLSGEPSISTDGRYVAFWTSASNLSAEALVGTGIFVHDMQAGTTTVASRQSAGDGNALANGDSADPSISADGRYVAFWSGGNNLSTADNDAYANIFVRDVLGPPAVEPPPSDTTPPNVGSTEAKPHQKLGAPLELTIACDEDCDVQVTATAVPHGHAKRAKKLKFKPASAQLIAATPTKLKLKPTKKTARALKAAAKAKATVVVTATDAAGNPSTKTLKIKLR